MREGERVGGNALYMEIGKEMAKVALGWLV